MSIQLDEKKQVKTRANSFEVTLIFLSFNLINLYLPRVGIYGNGTNIIDGANRANRANRVDGAEDLDISIIGANGTDGADRIKDPNISI